MSPVPEPIVEPSQCIDANPGYVTEQSTSSWNNNQDIAATKRPEMLRHVFYHSSRCSTTAYNRGSSARVSKTDHYRSAFLYRRQLKSRGTFHKVISSFFGNTSGRRAYSTSPQIRSRASSFGSRLGSSIHGSVPSIDLVSPSAFLFSGPSLQSAGSYNYSTPRLPSLTGSFNDARVPRRVHSDSFSMIDNASFNDELLEPIMGQGMVRSMSDVLLGINTPIEELEDSLLEGSDDETVSLDRTSTQSGRPTSNATWPSSSPSANDIFQNLVITGHVLRHSNTATWENLKLTCRFWYKAVTYAVPPARPVSGRLPIEILLGIYNYLDAKDFNAARRTCRSWMMASLNEKLLSAMLQRGGWHSGIETMKEEFPQKRSAAANSDEWKLSGYLSRQCALTSRWTGNGLDARPAIVESIEIDFSELADGYAPQKGGASGGLIFTSSICGKYLLVAKGSLIYVYGLKDGQLQPLTSVVCPRRVLAMSMNASVGRDAVAALLGGRMGMVCELRYGRSLSASESEDTCVEGDGYPPRTSARPTTPIEETIDLQDTIGSTGHASPRLLRGFPYVQSPSLNLFNAIELKAHNQGYSLQDTDDSSTHGRNLINQTWNLNLRGPLKNLRKNSGLTRRVQSIPIESGTSTFYRHLCSEDDPPRNVSICPQRRCVAFGCSAGIELHWIDALTGQSLSRWFPLTAPSDHLHFLSPRPGFECAKKLRLISSAAHPNDGPAISRRLFSNSTISSFWGPFGFEARARQSRSGDYCHAIPLSDGHHVLFMDPSTDRLTLGCDAPLGGPAKLLRKVVFNPPEEKVVPRVYTAAADMSLGARIVVVFDDSMMLYSIPPDVLTLSRMEQAADSRDVHDAPPFSPIGRHYDHWLNWWDEPTAFDVANRSEADNNSSIWPISLSGTEIGRLADVCELAIQTRPDILIWAFTYKSQCKTWRLHNDGNPILRCRQYVDRSGFVHECYDVDGSRDVTMQDAPPDSVASSAMDVHVEGEDWEKPRAGRRVIVGLDGNASGVLKRIPRALAVEKDSCVDRIDVAGCTDAWFEGGGDVVTWCEV